MRRLIKKIKGFFKQKSNDTVYRVIDKELLDPEIAKAYKGVACVVPTWKDKTGKGLYYMLPTVNSGVYLPCIMHEEAKYFTNINHILNKGGL